nr:uncharacterized protein LOC127330890 [Lolium perenne]
MARRSGPAGLVRGSVRARGFETLPWCRPRSGFWPDHSGRSDWSDRTRPVRLSGDELLPPPTAVSPTYLYNAPFFYLGMCDFVDLGEVIPELVLCVKLRGRHLGASNLVVDPRPAGPAAHARRCPGPGAQHSLRLASVADGLRLGGSASHHATNDATRRAPNPNSAGGAHTSGRPATPTSTASLRGSAGSSRPHPLRSPPSPGPPASSSSPHHPGGRRQRYFGGSRPSLGHFLAPHDEARHASPLPHPGLPPGAGSISDGNRSSLTAPSPRDPAHASNRPRAWCPSRARPRALGETPLLLTFFLTESVMYL